MSILDRPDEVTSYSHPPAKEQVRPLVLLETTTVLVNSVAPSIIAKISSVLSVFWKERVGATLVANGTPRVKVAETLVALSTVTESAVIPSYSAHGV